jgi:hypothetical protein
VSHAVKGIDYDVSVDVRHTELTPAGHHSQEPSNRSDWTSRIAYDYVGGMRQSGFAGRDTIRKSSPRIKKYQSRCTGLLAFLVPPATPSASLIQVESDATVILRMSAYELLVILLTFEASSKISSCC